MLQDKIVLKTPERCAGATNFQNWMTVLFLVFTYLGLTEVYEKTELMIFKPKLHEVLKKMRKNENDGLQQDGRRINRELLDVRNSLNKD